MVHNRSSFSILTVLLLVATSPPMARLAAAPPRTTARADDTKFKWVIVNTASALGHNGSHITLTGNGTFIPGAPDVVSGGGTWRTIAPDGVTVTGSGTFTVTRLVRFDLAPGAVANPTIHAGLAFLQVDYSDGSQGVLVVSCRLPGTPDSVLEGATASKGFTDFSHRLTPSRAFFQVVT